MSNGHERQTKRLPDLLVEVGLIDRFQLQRAAVLQKQTGARLCRALVDNGFVDEERLVRTLSAALKLESVTLSAIKIHERVLSRIPTRLARSVGALPVAIKRANHTDYLYVAMSDPMDTEAVAELERATGCTLSILVAPPTQLDSAIERYYGAATPPADRAPPPVQRPSTGATPQVRPAPPTGTPPLGAPTPSNVAPTPRPGTQGRPVLTAAASPQPSRHAQPPTTRGLVKPSGSPQMGGSASTLRRNRSGEAAPVGPPPPDMTPGPRLPPLQLDREDSDLVLTQLDPSALLDSGKAPTKVRVHDRVGAEASQVDSGKMAGSVRVDPDAFALPDIVPASAWDDGKTLDVDIEEMDPADLAQLLTPAGMPSMDAALVTKQSETSEALELDEVVEDGPEDIATSEIDLNSPEAAAALSLQLLDPLAGVPPTEAAVPVHIEPNTPAPAAALVSNDFVAALELPVDLAESPSPFDGLREVNVPAGLERTGIIPVIDWDREEFEPPPLDGGPSAEHARHLAGAEDIPSSLAEVRARSGSEGPSRAMSTPAPARDPAPAVAAPKPAPAPRAAPSKAAPAPTNAAPAPRVTAPKAAPTPTPAPPPPPPRAPASSAGKATRPEVPMAPKPSSPPQAAVTETGGSLPQRSEAPPPSVAPPEPPPEPAPHLASGPLEAEPATSPKPETVDALREVKLAEEATNPRIASDEIEDALDGEATPVRGRVERADVLAELESDPPVADDLLAPEPPPRTAPTDEYSALVTAMIEGRSLTSADRAQLVLALGRVLVAKGVVSAAEIAAAIRD